MAITLQTALIWGGSALAGLGLIGSIGLAATELSLAARRRARLSDTPGSHFAGPSMGEIIQSLTGPISKLGDRIIIRDPAQLSVVRDKLVRAGFVAREAVPIYLGARMVLVIAAIVGMVMILPWAIAKGGGPGTTLIAAALAGVAMFAPDKVLGHRQKKRELEFREGFPDFMDLLVASVEAGLSLDAGVTRVRDEIARRYPNLADQFGVLILELRAGKARRDAWYALAQRLGIEEAHSLATMLRQAEEMGASLGDTLTLFSDDMRTKRMLHAEEKAMALPAKLMIPLIFFIFPCLLGVLILPAAFRISQTLMANGGF